MTVPQPVRAALVLAAFLATVPAASAATILGPPPEPGVTRAAILVGNNWDGTTDIVDPETYERLGRVNVIPDKDEREGEILLNPVKAGFFLAIRELIGEGNHQYNDDVFSSNDGRTLFVSRPSYADVVAIDLATKQLKWRAPVDGYRSDHMAINADGTRLLVSASTGNVVHELDTATGARVGGFPSGDSPHESIFSKDGSTIYHASIGRVYLPTDRPTAIDSASKGGEFFQVVDARSGKVLKQIDMSQKLAEAGHPGFSAAVRPMTLSPDERFAYFQISFFHGFVEYDLKEEKVTRLARLPLSDEAAKLVPEQYLLDSAHHGIALDKAGRKFCVAGTMSDYGAIVQRGSFSHKILDVGRKPYWSTNSADGEYCYVSASQDDLVSVISYETEQVIHQFPVGRHPQRVRNGVVRIADYPQGKFGERFELGIFSSRQPVSFRGGDANIGCRAEEAVALRLDRCRIRLRTRIGGRMTTVGAGERIVKDARSFKVDVNLTKAGKALLRRRPGGVRVTAFMRGVDSVGRVKTTSRALRIRAAR